MTAWLVARPDGTAEVATGRMRPPAAVCELTQQQVAAWVKRDRATQKPAPASAGMAVARAWLQHGPRIIAIDGRRHELCRTGWSFERTEPVALLPYTDDLLVAVHQVKTDRFNVNIKFSCWVWAWEDLRVDQLASLGTLRPIPSVNGLVVVEGVGRVEVVLDGVVVGAAADRPSAQRAARRVLAPDAADATVWTRRNGALVRVD